MVKLKTAHEEAVALTQVRKEGRTGRVGAGGGVGGLSQGLARGIRRSHGFKRQSKEGGSNQVSDFQMGRLTFSE